MDRDRLVAKYSRLLEIHLRNRTAAFCTRLPGIGKALAVVKARIEAIDNMRLAA